MFKAEELGGRNRNCWYSTSESEGRKWDLVFLTSIFTLKYYSLDVSATKFWQKSFEALRRVGGRQFQINVLAPSALGSVFSLRCLSGDWAYFDTLLLVAVQSRSQRPRFFWSATGLTKRIAASRNEIGGCAAKTFTHAHKNNSARRIAMINHSRVCSPGERWLESRETLRTFLTF